MKQGWAQRLGPVLLLVLAGLGAFLWKGGFGLLPTERLLAWKVRGDFATIRRLELQLYDGETLIKREELKTPTGLSLEPTQKLVLGKGRYTARMLVWREKAAEPESTSSEVVVDDAEAITVETR